MSKGFFSGRAGGNWPSTTGNPSGGGRSNNPPGGSLGGGGAPGNIPFIDLESLRYPGAKSRALAAAMLLESEVEQLEVAILRVSQKLETTVPHDGIVDLAQAKIRTREQLLEKLGGKGFRSSHEFASNLSDYFQAIHAELRAFEENLTSIFTKLEIEHPVVTEEHKKRRDEILAVLSKLGNRDSEKPPS